MTFRGKEWLALVAIMLVGGFFVWGKMLKSSQYPMDWGLAAGAIAGAAFLAWLVWLYRSE